MPKYEHGCIHMGDNPLAFEDVGTDEGFKKIVDSLTNEIDLEGKTELNGIQVVAITRAAVVADRYDSKTLEALVLKVSKYLKSKDRKGLGELVEVAKGYLAYKAEKEKPPEVKV